MSQHLDAVGNISIGRLSPVRSKRGSEDRKSFQSRNDECTALSFFKTYSIQRVDVKLQNKDPTFRCKGKELVIALHQGVLNFQF